MFSFICLFLSLLFLFFANYKFKKYDIMKTVNGEEVLYLRRYFIFRSQWFNIFLHHIAQPDTDRHAHDHPFTFLSLVLKGGYTEQFYSTWKDFVTNVRKRFSVVYRPAKSTHKISHVEPNTWTLVFTGSTKVRDWGFLTEDGWVFWRKYLNIWEKVDMD